MLNTLPAELIHHIARCLDKIALADLRLTSSQLRQASYKAFGIAHFARYTIDLSSKSLERLLEIAEHDECRFAVCELLFLATDEEGYFEEWDIAVHLREPSGCLDLSHPLLRRVYRAMSERLVNCRLLRIESRTERLAEEDRGEGIDSPAFPHVDMSPTDAVAVALSTFGHSRTTVSELCWSIRGDWDLLYEKLHPTLYQSAPFQTAWAANLRKLDIECFSESMKSIDVVVNLVSLAENLRSLRLCVSTTERCGPDWLCAQHVAKLRPPTQLSSLTISFSETKQKDLFDLVSIPSLTSLTLEFIAIVDGDFRSLLRDLSETAHNLATFTLEELETVWHSRPYKRFSMSYIFPEHIREQPGFVGLRKTAVIAERAASAHEPYDCLRIIGGSPSMRTSLRMLADCILHKRS